MQHARAIEHIGAVRRHLCGLYEDVWFCLPHLIEEEDGIRGFSEYDSNSFPGDAVLHDESPRALWSPVINKGGKKRDDETNNVSDKSRFCSPTNMQQCQERSEAPVFAVVSKAKSDAYIASLSWDMSMYENCESKLSIPASEVFFIERQELFPEVRSE